MAKRTCLRCGSDKIIPNIPLTETHGTMGQFSSPLQVKVHGNPSAWIFKDTESGPLTASICGACGYTELKTEGFEGLYQKYVESLQGEKPASEEQRDPWPASVEERVVSAPPIEEPGDPTVCLSCGVSIPPDSNNCAECGWTWVVEDERP